MKITKVFSLLALAAFAGTPVVAFCALETDSVKTSAAVPAKAEKATVAVGKIRESEELAKSIANANATVSFNRIRQALTDNIAAAIQSTRKLTVIPLADIDICIEAVESGSLTLAEEIVDQEDVDAAFKAVDYMISVSVDDYQDSRKKKYFKSLGKEVEIRKIRLGGVVNFIEGRTATLSESRRFTVEKEIRLGNDKTLESEGGSETEQIFIPLATDFCRKFAFDLSDKLFPPKIIAVDKKGVLTINKGRDTDIYKGQIYEIYEEGEEITDPDTGEVLGVQGAFAGTAKVTHCFPKYSRLKVVSREEDTEIGVGCTARPAEEEDSDSDDD